MHAAHGELVVQRRHRLAQLSLAPAPAAAGNYCGLLRACSLVCGDVTAQQSDLRPLAARVAQSIRLYTTVLRD